MEKDTLLGMKDGSIPKRDGTGDKNKTVRFEDTGVNQERNALEMDWDYESKTLAENWEKGNPLLTYEAQPKRSASTPMDGGMAPPSFEETEIKQRFFCENCLDSHEPPMCPCPICGKRGHIVTDCYYRDLPESSPIGSERDSEQVWKQCPTCLSHHQGVCPCRVCNGLGHIDMDCPIVKRHHWQNPNMSRGRRNQVSPDRVKDTHPTLKQEDLKWCGVCGVSHHTKAKCLGPVVDKSIWCPECGMTMNTHLKGCTEPRGLTRICFGCRRRGHEAKKCDQCSYYENREHEMVYPEKSQESCKRCGSDQHPTKSCRVHQKFRDGYEELVRNDPISNIDQSIYLPEFTREEMDDRIKEMQKEKWKQHFLKYAKQRETPKRKPHQRPILEPRKIGHKIDTRMPRKDWTIYKEQNTNYGESSNTQGQHRMVGHQTPHEYTSRNQSTRTPRRSGSQQANTGGSPGGDPDDDPSEDPSDPPDPDPDGDPDPDDSGEETDTSEELGEKDKTIGKRGPKGRRGPQGYPGPPRPRGYPGPLGPPGRGGQNYPVKRKDATFDTTGLERSFAEYGRAMHDAIQGQNQINMTIADQLEVSIDAQNKHVRTMEDLVSENKKRGYDRFFRDISIFDGSNPSMFDDWADKLETACSISGRDIRLEAICYSSGPVRQILLTIPDRTNWEDIKAELRRNFSNKKTRAHATMLLSDYRHQRTGENLRNYIDSYSKLLMEGSQIIPSREYNLSQKLHFLRRLRNKRIACKIMRSREFRNYDEYSLDACMMKALELEDEYQIGELFTDDIAQVMGVDENDSGTDYKEELCMLEGGSSPRSRNSGFMNRENSNKDFNACFKCGRTGHFAKECPYEDGSVAGAPPPNVIGTVTHTMEAQTPVTDKSLTDFLYKNFKSTEKYKQKAGKLQTQLKKAKQDLKDAKKETQDVIAATTREMTAPKKTVTFSKNTTKKIGPSTKFPVTPRGKPKEIAKTKAKARTPTVVTTSGTTPNNSEGTKVIVKTEPITVVQDESEQPEEEEEGTTESETESISESESEEDEVDSQPE